MKQYIFFSDVDRKNVPCQEYIIEASGMMEALLKAKEMKASLEAESSSQIKLQFKGVVY
ncbi:hypothetical protein [Halalkalibacter urbisdiaboli]|uniref:hypothetical protein n=1 Tax=Halalkalibacter urbisdiaboli TaxID=1960589 RepID=UPI0013FD4183|nr:hypothetical protein [Halalkalibacter urbisdiaboli]